MAYLAFSKIRCDAHWGRHLLQVIPLPYWILVLLDYTFISISIFNFTTFMPTITRGLRIESRRERNELPRLASPRLISFLRFPAKEKKKRMTSKRHEHCEHTWLKARQSRAVEPSVRNVCDQALKFARAISWDR